MKLAYVATVAVLATSAAAAPTGVASTRRLAGVQTDIWYRMRGVDVIGKDTTTVNNLSFLDCATECFEEPPTTSKPCSAGSWVPSNGGAVGTCYFKAADFKGTPSIPKSGVDSFLLLRDSKSDVIVSGTSMNVDMPGNDLINVPGNDMNACRNACVANKFCYAVVRTDYNGGTCWLKSRASTFVPMAGAQSAYMARQF